MKWMCAIFAIWTMNLAPSAAQAIDWTDRRPEFPLHVARSGFFLEDASGNPFMIHGDTAWSLIAELKREDVNLYLGDRRERGFNALLINLVEHQFASNAPANAYGDRPFEGEAFKRMGKRYFEHAAWVLQRAQEEGFVVFIAPAYLGANGGGQGWYLEMVKAGNEALREYGMFAAERFRDFDNIVWVHGGDFDAPDKAIVRAVVSGIERVKPNSLHTVHSTRDTATADYWFGDQWLSIDTAYTYDDTRAAVLKQAGPGQLMPVVMIEGLYENEHGTDEQTIRRQAYDAMLSGAAGHFFGNNPIWNFGQGLYDSELSWQEALSSAGTKSMTHMRSLFESVPWWLLSPRFPIPGFSAEGEASAAMASDGSFALVYLADAQGVTFDRAIALPHQVQWFDPSSGRRYSPSAKVNSANALPLMPPAAHNAAGDRDWVLILHFDR